MSLACYIVKQMKARAEFEDTFTPNMAGPWTVKASRDVDLDHEEAERSFICSFKGKKFLVTQFLEIISKRVNRLQFQLY